MSWVTDRVAEFARATDELDEQLREVFAEVDHSHDRVMVQVHMPHITRWVNADPLRDLVYSWPGAHGPLAVGDLVICPPSPRHCGTFTGIVTSLSAEGHPYRGPVKALLGHAGEESQR